jgi:ribosome-binding factor A
MSIRQEKVAKEVQRDLAVVLNQIAPQILKGQLITLVDVEMSPDLGVAKVYLGFLNSEDKQLSLETVELHAKEIRRTFASGAGKAMRKAPEFRYYLDNTMDNAERINQLLNNLK